MRNPKLYEVYSAETGEFLAEGTVKQCAEQLGVTTNCFFHAMHKATSFGGHSKWVVEEVTPKLQKDIRIELSLTEEQARIVSTACDFYARVRLGQFNEILFHCLDIHPLPDDYYERRELAESLLMVARKQIYPELHGAGHSYGIGKFKDADLSFDVHQVIRHVMGSGQSPFSYYELPKCRRVEDGK